MTETRKAECEVCGKQGKAADKCTFKHACSCWYGVPCINGESMREHERMVAR